MRLWRSLLLSTPLLLQGSVGDQERQLLELSFIGSISSDKSPSYLRVAARHAVQKFLLRLAMGPVDERSAVAAIAPTPLQDLLDLGLVRREGGSCYLNFPLFTQADARLVNAVGERHAPSLMKAILARRTDFEALLALYRAPGVDTREVAFFLIGCASLDWDGLSLTSAQGYRARTRQQPDGRYMPHAEERSDAPRKGLYWGSRSRWYGKLSFTTFGDDAERRLTPPEGFAEPMLKMLLALRDGVQTRPGLSQASGIPRAEVDRLLPLLLGMDWVTEEKERIQAKIPVLTGRDDAMAKQIRALGREIMEGWLREHFPVVKEELKDLGFVRAGASFDEGFSVVWHYLFGIANRELIRAGFFADPYAPTRRFPGWIPAVYDLELQK